MSLRQPFNIDPPGLFPPELLAAHSGEIRLHMSHFFLRYLMDIYEAFEGDLALAIILGEISHHNTERMFSPDKVGNEPLRALRENPDSWTSLQGCNAYSMSCATGIPRETVRRKITELKKRGWIVDMAGQGLRITQACADHFGEDFSLRFLNGLLRASRAIEALLDEQSDCQPEPAPPISSHPHSKNTPKENKP